MIVPAIALGALVVFGIGYVFTHLVLGKIEEKIEIRERRKTGLIPPLHQRTLDVDSFSILGGVLAVVLVLTLLLSGSRDIQISIWYVLTGIGIIFGLLTFFIFGSESKSIDRTTQHQPAASTKVPPPRTDETDQHSQRLKESLYQNLLSKTRNNRELADRLIEFERKRKPNASETELIKSAIERWERDNS